MKIRVWIRRNFKIVLPFQFQIPSIPCSSRHLFTYSAIGATTVCFSYQCFRLRPWIIGEGNEAKNSSIYPQQLDNKYLQNFLSFLHKYFLFGNIYEFSNPRGQPINKAVACQLALDGIEIGEEYRPEIILKGAFGEADLAKFEIESANWKQKLMNIFKFKEKEAAEEQLIISEKQDGDEFDEELMVTVKLPEECEQNKWEWVEYLKQMIPYNNTQRRMKKIIKQLEIQFEVESECTHPFSNEIPRLLINVLDQFRGRNEEKTVSILKLLANNVQCCREAGELVAKSDWLLLLASMIREPVYDKERVLAHKVLVNTLYALSARNYSLLPHLYEMHRPIGLQSPKIDIDWLAHDLKEPVRLIALDYSSQLQRSLLKSFENLEARSIRFNKEFEKAGIGQRPVLFICHSMGGLLVKKMLIDNPELLNQTVGILFISTPHLGTPIASRYGRNILLPTEDVLLLKTESQLNRELNEHFRSQSKQIPLICTVLECRPTPVFREMLPMMLVPFEYAKFGRGAVYHLDEHHHDLCKPIDRNSPIYGIIRNFVNDSLYFLKKNSGLKIRKSN